MTFNQRLTIFLLRAVLLAQYFSIFLERGARVKKKCLVVDDLEENRMIAGVLIKDLGYEVEYAASGFMALFKIMTEKYQVVLMDYEIPFLNGLSVTAIFRKWERLTKNKRPLPIVAFSASKDFEQLSSSAANVFSGSLSKPIVIMELVKFLETQVSDRFKH